jgi:prepilin-type N-terminal cleavage/methylation domain-containing protein
MKNKKTNLLAFNLIEMVVTMTIISILAGVGITKFSQLKPPQEIINETTNIILTTINQTVYTSLNNTVSQEICNMQAGSGDKRASCKTTDFINNSWVNINNNRFNNLVTVQFTATNGKFISKITYQGGSISTTQGGSISTMQGGLISEITYTDNTPPTPIDTNNEYIINPITIKISLSSDSSCYNQIRLYPNNVTSVSKNCTI